MEFAYDIVVDGNTVKTVMQPAAELKLAGLSTGPVWYNRNDKTVWDINTWDLKV